MEGGGGDRSSGVCWVEGWGYLPQGLSLLSDAAPSHPSRLSGDSDLPVAITEGTLDSVQNFPGDGYPSIAP